MTCPSCNSAFGHFRGCRLLWGPRLVAWVLTLSFLALPLGFAILAQEGTSPAHHPLVALPYVTGAHIFVAAHLLAYLFLYSHGRIGHVQIALLLVALPLGFAILGQEGTSPDHRPLVALLYVTAAQVFIAGPLLAYLFLYGRGRIGRVQVAPLIPRQAALVVFAYLAFYTSFASPAFFQFLS
jgi:hypothetical protein